MLQLFQVPINERLFLFVAPVLELSLTSKRAIVRVECFGIDQANRTALECVCCASAVIVRF
jgi:hypothetical protein